MSTLPFLNPTPRSSGKVTARIWSRACCGEVERSIRDFIARKPDRTGLRGRRQCGGAPAAGGGARGRSWGLVPARGVTHRGGRPVGGDPFPNILLGPPDRPLAGQVATPQAPGRLGPLVLCQAEPAESEVRHLPLPLALMGGGPTRLLLATLSPTRGGAPRILLRPGLHANVARERGHSEPHSSPAAHSSPPAKNTSSFFVRGVTRDAHLGRPAALSRSSQGRVTCTSDEGGEQKSGATRKLRRCFMVEGSSASIVTAHRFRQESDIAGWAAALAPCLPPVRRPSAPPPPPTMGADGCEAQVRGPSSHTDTADAAITRLYRESSPQSWATPPPPTNYPRPSPSARCGRAAPVQSSAAFDRAAQGVKSRSASPRRPAQSTGRGAWGGEPSASPCHRRSPK